MKEEFSSNSIKFNRLFKTHPKRKRNKNTGATSLDDELSMINFKVFIKNNLGCPLDAIETIVTQEEDIQLLIGSLLLGLDIRDPTLISTS